MVEQGTGTATDLHTLLAEVSEDLAVELLSEFKAEDYQHLGHSIEKLVRVEAALKQAERDVPFPVQEVIENYRRRK